MTIRLSHWIFMALTSLLSIQQVSAENASSSISEVLKNYKPAGTCPTGDGSDKSSSVLNGKASNIAPDLSCQISPPDLSAMLGRSGVFLADVRPSQAYESVHIDSAANIPVSSLKTKNFLQEKNVVLIGDGKAERELYVACTELKSAGFRSVKVLRGGMTAWMLEKLPSLGRDTLDSQVTKMTTLELWGESQFDYNLVLIDQVQAKFKPQFVFASMIPKASTSPVKAVIERRRKELKNAPLASVLLILPPETTDAEIRQLQQDMFPVPVLVYNETYETFSRQLNQQKAVWAAQAHGPKKPGCRL